MEDRAASLSDRRAIAFARAAAVMVGLGALIALAGWILDVEGLKALFVRPPVTIKTNTALALLAGSLAVLLRAGRAPAGARATVGRAAAAFVALIGAATLCEHVFGWDLGIDQALFRETPGALATTTPNRMGPPASTSFVLLGLALLLFGAGGRKARVARQAAATGVLVIALLPVIGYATGVSPLFGVARLTGISLATALMLLALAAATLAAHPGEGLASLLSLPNEAGTLARRLLVPTFALPFAMAVALTRGVQAGWFDASFATASMALTLIVAITGLIWKTAADVSRALRARDAAEAERARLEEALRESNRRQT